jgi:hypothetical protein
MEKKFSSSESIHVVLQGLALQIFHVFPNKNNVNTVGFKLVFFMLKKITIISFADKLRFIIVTMPKKGA